MMYSNPVERTPSRRNRTNNREKQSPSSVIGAELGFWRSTSEVRDWRILSDKQVLPLKESTVTFSRGNPKLSTLMVQRKWTEARVRLLSESGKLEIREKGPIPFLSQGSCDALPLHLACAIRPLPPASFVALLIVLYPDAVRAEEATWGMLPLHFAVNMGLKKNSRQDALHSDALDFELIDLSADVGCATSPSELRRERAIYNQRCIVTSLVDAYPGSLWSKERFSGMLPIHIAASTSSSQYESLTSNAALLLELLLRRCPGSLEVKDDGGETARDIAWRQETFNCLRCRIRGRCVPLDHGRCPHVASPRQGRPNPLLREDLDYYLEMPPEKCLNKTLRSLEGTEITVMTHEESGSHSFNDSSHLSSMDELCSLESGSAAVNDNDAIIRLVGKNHASVSMQIRLENLHSGKGKRWTKKLRTPPNPFFEISVFPYDDSSAPGETIYRSYPLMKTTCATWDSIKALDVGLDACKKLKLRITVFDCDHKGGKHMLIGESEMNSLDLARISAGLFPIRRGEKVKGFLRLVYFQLDSA